MDIWKKISEYWQAKGWLYLFLGALGILFLCWLVSERNNLEGTYDSYELVRENNYFPQSIGKPKKKKKGIPQESRGEEICRNTLQDLFKQPFPKVRPDFLYNSVTGENLELDMYNKHYKLAVEYNGQQHYKYNSFMHSGSKDKFYNQQYRDRMKRDVCRKLGITLIEVPYTVKNQDIPNFLVNKLREGGFLD